MSLGMTSPYPEHLLPSPNPMSGRVWLMEVPRNFSYGGSQAWPITDVPQLPAVLFRGSSFVEHLFLQTWLQNPAERKALEMLSLIRIFLSTPRVSPSPISSSPSFISSSQLSLQPPCLLCFIWSKTWWDFSSERYGRRVILWYLKTSSQSAGRGAAVKHKRKLQNCTIRTWLFMIYLIFNDVQLDINHPHYLP